jgi:surface protein
MHLTFFESSASEIGNLSQWNTSKCTSMEHMFYMSSFDGDLSLWDTSNVESMVGMFSSDSSFQGTGIGQWNTGKVTSMESMFINAKNFNAPIGQWNTSLCQNM